MWGRDGERGVRERAGGGAAAGGVQYESHCLPPVDIDLNLLHIFCQMTSPHTVLHCSSSHLQAVNPH